MNRTITMPKCPYCGEAVKYDVGSYVTGELVGLATGRSGRDVVINCSNCGKSYEVTCHIRFYGRKQR